MKVSSPDIAKVIELAEAGDRVALARAYGEAAAWLRNDEAPPAALSRWLSGRLEELGVLIGRAGNGPAVPAELRITAPELRKRALQAIRVQRHTTGHPASRRAQLQSEQLARDVLQFLQAENLSPEAAIDRALAYHLSQPLRERLPVSRAQIKAAWYKHADKLTLNNDSASD